MASTSMHPSSVRRNRWAQRRNQANTRKRLCVTRSKNAPATPRLLRARRSVPSVVPPAAPLALAGAIDEPR
jgi:hypothetical protein